MKLITVTLFIFILHQINANVGQNNRTNTARYSSSSRVIRNNRNRSNNQPYWQSRNNRTNDRSNNQSYRQSSNRTNNNQDANSNQGTQIDRNRFHPYYNPNMELSRAKKKKEPILARRKPVDPNDPLEKHKYALSNLFEKEGILWEVLDDCIVLLLDKDQKFKKDFLYVRSWLVTEMFEEPDKNYPVFNKKKLKGKIVVMPVAINNKAHWACIVADTNQKTMEYYNSYDSDMVTERVLSQAKMHFALFTKIMNKRNIVVPSDKIPMVNWRLIKPKFGTPIQQDGVNCGAYVLMFVDKRINNGKPKYQGDVFHVRDAVLQDYVSLVLKISKKKPKTQKSKP